MSDPITPVVGMGATYHVGSDRYAFTIIEVRRNGRQLVLQRDTETLVAGHRQSEQQTYAYAANPGGETRIVNRCKGEIYCEKGQSGVAQCYCKIGYRRSYFDPGF